jgi:hypothetical protein
MFPQGSTPRVGMRFCRNVCNSPRSRKSRRHISYLLDKVVFFGPQRLLDKGKKINSSTLNVMISQMVRNESV